MCTGEMLDILDKGCEGGHATLYISYIYSMQCLSQQVLSYSVSCMYIQVVVGAIEQYHYQTKAPDSSN